MKQFYTAECEVLSLALLLRAIGDDPHDPDLVRPDIRQALDDWGKGGPCYMSGFVSAVLSNNLKAALGKADTINTLTLPAVVAYCYNTLPSPCWGSVANVKSWSASHERCVAEVG